MTYSQAYYHSKERLADALQGTEVNRVLRILFEDLFDCPFPELKETELGCSEADLLDRSIERLLKGEPINYVTGIKEFYGLRFKVDANVLIPRPETEELVAWMLESIGGRFPFVILDIGTGSGCIPIAIDKASQNHHHVYGLDVSEEALQVARLNNERLNASVNFKQGDILQLARTFDIDHDLDIIVSNPPYILLEEQSVMDQSVIDYEPSLALFTDGDDPLVFYKAINKFAETNLKSGGMLFYEISALHKPSMEMLMSDDLFATVEFKKDISGNWRMIKAIKR